MKNYVLGFVFNTKRTKIALIKKNKPDWQKGLWNGIGGKIEENETPLHAMEREFEEETGINISAEMNKWTSFALMHNTQFKCHCYKAFTDSVVLCKSMESEEVRVIDLENELKNYPLIFNLTWLIPLALDDSPYHSEIIYKDL